MLDMLLYTLAFATALSMVALCLEHLAIEGRRPRRVAWLLALLCSALLPPMLMLSARPEAAVAAEAADAILARPAPASERAYAVETGEVAARPSAATVSATAPVRATLWPLPTPSGKSLLVAWAVVSAGMLFFLAGAGLLLRRRSASWQRATIQGCEVLVSDDTGPALLGALRPHIVVPRWFLDEPADTQRLILRHEQQHIEARDPLMLRVATLIAMAAPWNLPLWWQLKRVRLAIELDCDSRVMRSGADAIRYGEVLLGVTQRATAMPLGVIAMSEPVSALERRIRSLSPAHGRHAVLRMTWASSLAAAGIGAAAALEVPAFQQMAQAPVVRPANPATPTTPATGLAPATSAMPAPLVSSATPASDAAPAQQSGTEVQARITREPQGSIEIIDCAAARAWCREAAIRRAFALDPVMDDRKNKDGTYVDPLTFGKPICRVTRDGVPEPLMLGETQLNLEALKALAKDCKPLNVFGTPNRAAAVDLNIIPPYLLQRMEVVTGGASATYGSGAMAGVVNLVLNNRLRGVNIDLDYDDNPDQFRFSIGTRFPNGAPADTGVDNFQIIIIPGENTRAIAPQVRFEQYVGDDSEVVTALVTMQARGLWNPQVLAGPLARLVSPSGRISETPDGTSLKVVDTWANVRSIAAALRGQTGQR